MKFKPPLGVEPKRMWKLRRLDDLKSAIDRYKEANMIIPIEWVTEYNELLVEIKESED